MVFSFLVYYIKIKKITKNTAVVDFGGVYKQVSLGILDNVKKGDYVFAADCQTQRKSDCTPDNGKECAYQTVFNRLPWFAEAKTDDQNVSGNGDTNWFGNCKKNK